MEESLITDEEEEKKEELSHSVITEVLEDNESSRIKLGAQASNVVLELNLESE